MVFLEDISHPSLHLVHIWGLTGKARVKNFCRAAESRLNLEYRGE